MNSPAAEASTELRVERSPWREGAICLAVALLTAAAVICDFCPTFANWRGLGNYIAHRAPEYGRANALLMQTDSPFEKSFDPLHRVIAWRLLFPVLWHYLHLPKMWLLAMPQVGCVAVLWLVAWLTRRRTAAWSYAILTTILFATFSWFFVSTGWLGYFDSWLVLGLLVAAFVPRFSPFFAACLLTPWIDERFILALPVTLLVRSIALGRVASRDRRAIWHDALAAAAACSPYLAIRLITLAVGDTDPAIYAEAHARIVAYVPASRFIAGLWSGYRAGWVFPVAAAYLVGRQAGWLWGAALGLAVAICAIGGLFIAADMSRTMAMVSPAVLLGIWLAAEAAVSEAHWILPAAVLVNLLFPASHELWYQHFPVLSLPTEVARYRGPVPGTLRAAELIEEGIALVDAGDLAAGREKYDEAINMQQRYGAAFAHRAALSMRENDADGALADVEEALKINANMPLALYLRGHLRAARGQRDEAIVDLREAIYHGGHNWIFRPQAQSLLDQLTGPATSAQP